MSAALIFAAAAALTIHFASTMGGGMKMPGNWTMSMMWMSGSSFWLSALVFAGMWLAMMVAMMLPSTYPMLRLYERLARFRGEKYPTAHCAVVAGGYFAVWSTFGLAAWLAGSAIVRAATQSAEVARAVPLAAGCAVAIAGAYQLTPAKSACLSHCRDPLLLFAGHGHGHARGALALGLHHGAYCAACCWGLMLIQLSLGIMDLRFMALVAVVIALEKLAPRGVWIARVTGVAALIAGAAIAWQSLR